MTRIILQSKMSCSTFGLYVAYLNHRKSHAGGLQVTQPWPVSSLLTSGQAYQKYLTTATVNASFFVGFITNEFRILERLTFILHYYNGKLSSLLQWQCAMCVAMAMQCIAIQCRHLTFPFSHYFMRQYLMTAS